MTVIELLDKQLSRLTAAGIAGCGIFALTVAVLWLAAAFPELRKDELFRVLAQAIVVQGLIGLAMASWFTVRHGDKASGKPGDPVNTHEVEP